MAAPGIGNGTYFPTTTYSGLVTALETILSQVQAVNSAFAAVSLPVSVNTQGTYLNQVFVGMFKPDQNTKPRWYGNLKQYQFIYNPTTRVLALGDAAGLPAISAAGTGFLDPSIASFWKRRTSVSVSSSPDSTFSAHSRFSCGLQARYTTPIPPSPSFSRIR